MMTPEVTVIHSDTANRRSIERELRSQNEDEALAPESRSTPLFFWVGDRSDVQPTQPYQIGTVAEQSYSTAGLRSLKDRPLMGRVLCRAFSPSEPRGHAQVGFDPVVESFAEGFPALLPSGSSKYSVFSDPTSCSVEADATASFSQFGAGELSTIMGPLQRDMMQVLRGSAMFVPPGFADVGYANLISKAKAQVEVPLSPIVQSFAEGCSGVRPSADTVKTATKIVEASFQHASERDIEVDETDGALSFELRLKRGFLVVGELSLVGSLHANVYNDQHPDVSAGIEEIWVKHLPGGSAEDLIALF